MIAWVLLVLLVAVVFMLGVERLLRRLGVARAKPEDAPGGVRDVLDQVERWQDARGRAGRPEE